MSLWLTADEGDGTCDPATGKPLCEYKLWTEEPEYALFGDRCRFQAEKVGVATSLTRVQFVSLLGSEWNTLPDKWLSSLGSWCRSSVNRKTPPPPKAEDPVLAAIGRVECALVSIHLKLDKIAKDTAPSFATTWSGPK